VRSSCGFPHALDPERSVPDELTPALSNATNKILETADIIVTLRVCLLTGPKQKFMRPFDKPVSGIGSEQSDGVNHLRDRRGITVGRAKGARGNKRRATTSVTSCNLLTLLPGQRLAQSLHHREKTSD